MERRGNRVTNAHTNTQAIATEPFMPLCAMQTSRHQCTATLLNDLPIHTNVVIQGSLVSLHTGSIARSTLVQVNRPTSESLPVFSFTFVNPKQPAIHPSSCSCSLLRAQLALGECVFSYGSGAARRRWMSYVEDHHRYCSCIEPSGLNFTGSAHSIQQGSRFKAGFKWTTTRRRRRRPT